MPGKNDFFKHVQSVLDSGAPDTFFELRALKPNGGGSAGSYWIPQSALQSDLNQAWSWAGEKYRDGADCFIGLNGRDERRGTKAAVTKLSACYVDLDTYKLGGDPKVNKQSAVDALLNAALKPNLIVDSGGGIQAIWFFDPTDNKAVWSNLQSSLQERFSEFAADLAIVTDEARVLRLTPFANRKDNKERPTGIIYSEPGRRSFSALALAYPSTSKQIIARVGTSEIPNTVRSGTRNDTLMSLAGSMRGRGMPQEAIAAALLVVNEQRCQPPLSEQEVRAVARSAMRYAPDEELRIEETVNVLGKPLGNFMSTAFLTSEQIITGLARGELGVLQALPGVGKTTWSLNVAICAAIGREFMPVLGSGDPCRVVFFDFENRANVLQRDLSKMLSSLDEHDRKLADRNLMIVVDEQIGDVELKLSDAVHNSLATKICQTHKADLVIIDALAAGYCVINENDNAEVNRTVLVPLQKLLKDSGAAGLLVHHIGKSGEGDSGKIYRSRGASVLPAYARAVFDLSPDRDEPDCVVLHCAKVKGPGFKDAVLRLDREARWFQPVQNREPSQSSYQRLVNLVTREMSAAEIKELAVKELGISRATVERLLRNAVNRGALAKTARGKYAAVPQINREQQLRCRGGTRALGGFLST